MAYRYDKDLEFLSKLSSDELKGLADVLIKDPKDGELRLTESITVGTNYKRYGEDYSKYWEDLAEELQKFGGNSFANFLRFNEGVLYREILCDVCDKQGVNYNKNSSTTTIETNLLQKILEDMQTQLSDEQLKELAKEFGIEYTQLKAQGLATIGITVFRLGGFKSYVFTLKLINFVWRILFGHGLRLAGNAAIARTLSLAAGPIGWIITGFWTAWDIAGPAYRVTFPAVLQIIALRQTYLNKSLFENM
ncbi:DUF3944 domain-containing protein [Campylobacter sp. MG1]|uniref:DUF3944 domain-containing protein n=1 Tax=Campylobacter sp. MG1 TaxID=2976332 RepID=UPI00226CDE3C|nr:DUF3944 domain-containing protein [Campylobacter sp. MG1]